MTTLSRTETISSDGGSWQDAESDGDESLRFHSFFTSETFDSLSAWIEDCHQNHGFDIGGTIRRLELDFHQIVKLVNYLRSSHVDGPSLAKLTLENFDSDGFLQPVIEDDAVLFSIDEIIEHHSPAAGNKYSVAELVTMNRELEETLELLKNQFQDYKLTVQETLDKRWTQSGEIPGVDPGSHSIQSAKIGALESSLKSGSDGYFESYAGNDIHETMLKDTVRTDAYRDFIYGNKEMFKGKVVLDIGCGTGILSMFAAKAGAKQVIAVDNSDIIHKARSNIYHNGLSATVSALHGNVESVNLPASEVDIIVSEWMGYCLLYEAMLPSVLSARDRYLASGGLMAPSSATLWIAPFSDARYVHQRVDFWKDVYGFSMTSMQEGIYDDVQIEQVPKESICGKACPFKVLDLRTVATSDLSFIAEWECELISNIEALDGFVVWFDNFFASSARAPIPGPKTTPAQFTQQHPGNVAFTTGPHGEETHWKQGLLMIPRPEQSPVLLAGSRLRGTIEFARDEDYARGLGLSMTWSTATGQEQSRSWHLK